MLTVGVMFVIHYGHDRFKTAIECEFDWVNACVWKQCA